MVSHVSILVRGKVQGVFYRASAQQKARELGITGYAKNEPDGSVYIEAEGSPTALEKFELWCRQGPARAIVDSITVQKGETKNYTRFEIRR